MTIKELCQEIRDFRGNVVAPVLMKDDVLYVKLVKQDLMAGLLAMGPDTKSPFITSIQNEELVLDAAH